MDVIFSIMACVLFGLGTVTVWGFVCLICLDRNEELFIFGTGIVIGCMLMALYLKFAA